MACAIVLSIRNNFPGRTYTWSIYDIHSTISQRLQQNSIEWHQSSYDIMNHCKKNSAENKEVNRPLTPFIRGYFQLYHQRTPSYSITHWGGQKHIAFRITVHHAYMQYKHCIPEKGFLNGEGIKMPYVADLLSDVRRHLHKIVLTTQISTPVEHVTHYL